MSAHDSQHRAILQRIARKAIAEGDLYRICDHEVRFSYR